MSLSRYYNERESSTGEPLYWGRAKLDGAPFRGVPPMLREEEFDEHAERSMDAHVRIFNLSRPEELQDYRQILERVCNQRCMIVHRERQYDPATRSFLVLLEWVEPFIEVPQAKTAGLLIR